MTAEPIWDDVHAAVERLPPDRARRILRLVVSELDAAASDQDVPRVAQPDQPLSWAQLKASADTLPAVDYARFRADLDSAIDGEFKAGDEL
jgi:hypothetical protein